MTKTPKVLVGITAGLALLVGPTAAFAGVKAKAKKKSTAVAIKDKSKNNVSGNTSCTAEASGLVAIPVNACDVLDLSIDDSLNNLLQNLLRGGLL
ncbi:MAG: hypothetical protein ACT4OS_02790 [Acidimicrobiales bacterium]